MATVSDGAATRKRSSPGFIRRPNPHVPPDDCVEINADILGSLSPTELGCVLSLLCWVRGTEPYPAREDHKALARIVGVTPREWRRLAPVVMAMMDRRSEWTRARCE
jgi:hypothetical protein